MDREGEALTRLLHQLISLAAREGDRLPPFSSIVQLPRAEAIAMLANSAATARLKKRTFAFMWMGFAISCAI